MTLVIMAAGMGSRYGGLKQIDPVGPNGEFIIDYSIYDAIKAGFTKVVFIIKKENEEIFKETIGKRVEKQIDIEYAFQDLNDLPNGFKCPTDRIKPWGTTHAILACKNIVKENFAIINADDFYGLDAYMTISKYLKTLDTNSYNSCSIAYEIANTLTENGAVKRGICEVENGYLVKLTESKAAKEGNVIKASPLDGSEPFIVDDDTPVAVNMFGFTPKIFALLEEDFDEYLKENENNLDNCERILPDSLFKFIKRNIVKIEVLNTSSKWYGVTYKEDRPMIVNAIKEMLEKNEYPKDLWD